MVLVEAAVKCRNAFSGLPFFGCYHVSHQMLNAFTFVRMNVQRRRERFSMHLGRYFAIWRILLDINTLRISGW